MPSRRSVQGACALLLLATLFAVARAAPLPAAGEPPPAAGSTVTDADVQRARKALEDDPLMGGMQAHKRLHWRDPDKPEKSTPRPWLERVLRWLAEAGRWIASSARALVLVVAAIGVALIAVVIWRSWQRRSGAGGVDVAPPPTHVRGLDIRPDELPPDVPAAARALWLAGEQRAALVLLYRALLSALAHGFQVPIRDSSTEGDCLAMARGRVPEAGYDYAREFVSTWLAAVYAGQWPADSRFEALCSAHVLLRGATP
ncbi:MAG: hypothetical protein RL684_2632 [Pseudomonadota bacterium]